MCVCAVCSIWFLVGNQTNPSNGTNAFGAPNDLLLNCWASWNCLQTFVHCIQRNRSRCGCRALCMGIVIASRRPTQFPIQSNYSCFSAAKTQPKAVVCQWVMKMNRRQLLSLFNDCHASKCFVIFIIITHTHMNVVFVCSQSLVLCTRATVNSQYAKRYSDRMPATYVPFHAIARCESNKTESNAFAECFSNIMRFCYSNPLLIKWQYAGVVS